MRNISSLELLRFIYANYSLPSKEVGIFCFLIDEKKLSVEYNYGPSHFVNQIIKRIWELQNRDVVFALTKGMLIVSKPKNQYEAYKMFEDVIFKELI